MNALVWHSAVAVIVGYVVGSLNPAAAIARMRGVDLRGSGSGNPGATNAGRVMGKSIGVLVAVLDILKGLIPSLVFAMMWGEVAGHLAGLAAVLGHITSPLLKGKGGKGVATAAGAVLAVDGMWMVPALVLFGITYVATKRMGIASVAAFLTLPVTAWVTNDELLDLAFAVVLAVLIVVRHQWNIRVWIQSFGAGKGKG